MQIISSDASTTALYRFGDAPQGFALLLELLVEVRCLLPEDLVEVHEREQLPDEEPQELEHPDVVDAEECLGRTGKIHDPERPGFPSLMGTCRASSLSRTLAVSIFLKKSQSSTSLTRMVLPSLAQVPVHTVAHGHADVFVGGVDRLPDAALRTMEPPSTMKIDAFSQRDSLMRTPVTQEKKSSSGDPLDTNSVISNMEERIPTVYS